jgi:O-antigen/teichoic acid export membrane protein
MQNHSLKKRYLYKLLSSLFGFLINIIFMGIIPKSLGVIDFGKFNFTTTQITKFYTLLDFKSSMYFFTKFSQTNEKNSLIKFYQYFFILICFVLTIFLSFLLLFDENRNIFPNISISIIILSLVYVILNSYQDFLINLMDGSGLSVQLEKSRLFLKIIAALFLAFLYLSNLLNIQTYFYYNFLNYTLLSLLLIFLINRSGINLKLVPLIKKKYLHFHIKHLLQYSSPLFLYLLFSLIQETFDRWLLQYYSGSIEQGYYSFSYYLNNLSLIFISAMFPLFTRELSIKAKNNDILGMSVIFRKYLPIFYSLTAIISSFIFFNSDVIINIFGGSKYIGAISSMKALTFFSAITVFSMLNGSVIYANGKTKIFLILSLILVPIGMLTSYFLLSNNMLNMGSTGLSIKIVVFELIPVLIILKINTKFLNLKYLNFIYFMIFPLLVFLFFSYTTRYIIELFFTSNLPSFQMLIYNGFLYLPLVLLTIIINPLIIGINRVDFNSLLIRLRLKFINL